jgi:DNA invertase Pin-like site-specific DNA recombinase
MPKKRLEGNPKVAIAYLRVSTDRQEHGPDAQRAAIKLWCDRNEVRLIPETFHDTESGADTIADRPALLRALRALEEHGAGMLIAAKRDRFARDPAIMSAIEGESRKAGAVVRTADGMSDADGSIGMLQKGVQDVFSAYERELIRERTKAALAVKRSRGELVSRHPPYGFKLPPGWKKGSAGSLLRDPEEQATIARAKALRKKGQSLRAIAAQLAREGRLNRKGAPFSPTALLTMFQKVDR